MRVVDVHVMLRSLANLGEIKTTRMDADSLFSLGMDNGVPNDHLGALRRLSFQDILAAP